MYSTQIIWVVAIMSRVSEAARQSGTRRWMPADGLCHAMNINK